MSMMTDKRSNLQYDGQGVMGFLREMLRTLGAILEDLMLGDSFLGHGRRWESFAVCIAGYYAIIFLFVPEAARNTSATTDIFNAGYGDLIGVLLWLMFITSFLGLLFNVRGIRYSRTLRVVGASLGFLVWGWFALKLALIGLAASPGHVLSTMTALYEIRVVFMALANLPRPGAPGQMGLAKAERSGA